MSRHAEEQSIGRASWVQAPFSKFRLALREMKVKGFGGRKPSHAVVEKAVLAPKQHNLPRSH